MKYLLLALLFVSSPVFAAVAITESTEVVLIKDGAVVRTHPSQTACRADARARHEALTTKTSGTEEYVCRVRTRIIAKYSSNSTCPPPQPAPETRAGACPAGTSGTWLQTRTYSCPTGATSWVAGAWTPAAPAPGVCVPTPPPTDTDGDGVPDSSDACPTVPANTPNGCPFVPPGGEFEPINLGDPADAPLVKFGETALRNWNFEGHTVQPVPAGAQYPFTEEYGKWSITATTYEPWLFDRASVAYIMWKRTGDARWRTEFDTLFAFYRTHIDAQGIFTPKGQDDTKYSYVRPFYYYEQATGDTQYRPIAKRIHDAWVRELPNTYSTGIALWTEREVGLALEAAIFYHKLTGDAAALTRARAMVAQWGTVAAQTGAPLHTLEQHGEEFDNAYASMKMTSSWMSALYFAGLKTYYEVTQDQEALRQISRYVDFIDAHGLVDGSAFHPEFTGVTVPYYLYGVGTFYDRETPSEDDISHCLDVAALFKFGIEAKLALGQNTQAADIRYVQLRQCAVRGFTNFTRSTITLPKYRLNPPRLWNWWSRAALLQ